MTEQLFNALKAIETLASGAMKVYALPSGKGLGIRNDMVIACDMGHIIPAVQALALGLSINHHGALSLGYYCLISGWPTLITKMKPCTSRIYNLKQVSGNVLILLVNAQSKA